MQDLLWPIEAMRQAPAQVAAAVVAGVVVAVDQHVIMQVETATAITGRAGDIAPKLMWHSCKKTAGRPAECAAAAGVAPIAPTAMTTVRFGRATVTASTPT